jgi:predicted hydrocarbon binding protein
MDFESAWLAKFARSLDEVAGTRIRVEVMQGSDGLSSDSNRQDIVDWTRRAVERLETLVDEQDRKAIMTRCACQYPRSQLRGIRNEYQATKDIKAAHQLLQAQFESFLRETLHLNDELVEDIIGMEWGAAGRLEGRTIIATKIPKSGFLLEYMRETDPERKRQLYCHCPRIRDVLKTSETISSTYCYCGAGFYKGIWEEIVQSRVEVEVLESVLGGSEVCRIAIHVPLATS